jgi:hypothetical protein
MCPFIFNKRIGESEEEGLLLLLAIAVMGMEFPCSVVLGDGVGGHGVELFANFSGEGLMAFPNFF